MFEFEVSKHQHWNHSNQLLSQFTTKRFQTYTQLLWTYWRYASEFLMIIIKILQILWIFELMAIFFQKHFQKTVQCTVPILCNKLLSQFSITYLPWKIALRFWTIWTSCPCHISPIEQLSNLAIFTLGWVFVFFAHMVNRFTIVTLLLI
jgi:hypothetical protein